MPTEIDTEGMVPRKKTKLINFTMAISQAESDRLDFECRVRGGVPRNRLIRNLIDDHLASIKGTMYDIETEKEARRV
jgi:hypothetical protein